MKLARNHVHWCNGIGGVERTDFATRKLGLILIAFRYMLKNSVVKLRIVFVAEYEFVKYFLCAPVR